jgi:RimJ/RimL family protein N-acetyltransferase
LFLQGPRVTIRPLTRADLDAMAAWRPFDDPLHADANWAQRRLRELDRWYAHRSADPRRLLYTVTDEGKRVIGSITLREIDGRRSARLGITLGADYVNQGYGSEALTLFLNYYFGELGFEKMVLDVTAHNRRAIRVYEKLGFKRVGQREQSVGRGKALALLKEPRYADVRRFFRRDRLGRYWALCYDMELTREDWKKERDGLSW